LLVASSGRWFHVPHRAPDLALHSGNLESIFENMPDDHLDVKLGKIAPRVHAFASNDVMAMFDAMLNTSERPTPDADARYNREERLGIQLDSLLFHVRTELQPDTKPKPAKGGRPRLHLFRRRRALGRRGAPTMRIVGRSGLARRAEPTGG
jgi:hypothetical protein